MNGKDLYKQSGVDIDAGDSLVSWLQSDNKSQLEIPEGAPLSGLGGFSGLFRVDFSQMKKPVLVAGTDGVGTKLLLALEHDRLGGVGEDLVAMCANDLYCVGAKPLFFLDYYASGKLDQGQFQSVLTGIKKGLGKCSTHLLGGETAELPGLYQGSHFDLAGFIVGCVDEDKALGPHKVKKGDRLVAIHSSGFHSNGYSLIRSWLAKSDAIDSELIDALLTPTEIYGAIPDIIKDLPEGCIHALANITGGGLSGNLVRVLTEDLDGHIGSSRIPTPDWMRAFILAHTSSLLDVESVLNLGVGMIAAIDQNTVSDFCGVCEKAGYQTTEIGEVKPGSGKVHIA